MSKQKASRPVGRPTLFDANMASEICGRIAAGESLASICRDPTMPGQVAVYRWIATNEGFKKMYEQAREEQAETLADELKDIVDAQPAMVVDERGTARVDAGWVSWQKLRLDGRKWIAAKLQPRKYGDRVTNNHEGGVSLQVVTGVPTE